MTTKLHIQHIAHLTGHKGAIYALCEDSDPHCFYSAGGDGWIVKWDVRQPEQGTAIAQVPTQIFSMTFLPHQQLLAVGSMQGILYFIDLQANKVVDPTLQLEGSIFALISDAERLYIGTGSGYLYQYQLHTQQIISQTRISEKSLRCIARHPQDNYLVIGSSDHLIHIFDLSTSTIIPSTCSHENSIFSLLFSLSGDTLLSGSRDAHIVASDWQIKKSPPLFTRQKIPAHHFTINHLINNQDGTLVFSASRDKSIKIWAASDLQLLKVIDLSKEHLLAHKNSVNRLLWLPRKNYLISGSDDRSLMMYNIQL